MDIIINHIDSFFIDRHGWFPSAMKMTKHDNRTNKVSYDESILISNQEAYSTIKITYEPKYDILLNNPSVMFHLSIQEHTGKVKS